MNSHFFSLVFTVLLAGLLVCSCVTKQPQVPEPAPAPPEPPNIENPAPAPVTESGISEEIRSLIEKGTPASLQRALDLIRTRELETGNFGRTMHAIAVTLMRKLYPDPNKRLPTIDSSGDYIYTKIITEAARGIYIKPSQDCKDYLECVLPFLALLSETEERSLMVALTDLRRAEGLNPQSVLAPYFIGYIYERSKRYRGALLAYSRVLEISSECYPATLGMARILNNQGQKQEAIQLLQDLIIRFPDNITIKQELALAYYHNRDWSRAEPIIEEILQRNRYDPQLLLMQAHILIERGLFLKAGSPLDSYAAFDQNNWQYLFFRAKIQAEGYHNREAALIYLRSMLRSPAVSTEALVYAASMFLESSRQEDHIQGQELLHSLLSTAAPSLLVLDLAFQDAVQRNAWEEAKPYLDRLLKEGPSSKYLLDAYKVERALGNIREAFDFAKAFHQQDDSNEEGNIVYTSALIDIGEKEEAGKRIENRLAHLNGGILKAKYYYLRSRLSKDEESAINDLRSSLFEDPRNLDTLTALFEIYHRRNDERRALYYLKQALTFTPNNARLEHYRTEYHERGLL